jgi:hypothetical protein
MGAWEKRRFLVVLPLGYRIFGAFGPWKDVRAFCYCEIHISSVAGAHGSTCRFVVWPLSRAKAARTKVPTTGCWVA